VLERFVVNGEELRPFATGGPTVEEAEEAEEEGYSEDRAGCLLEFCGGCVGGGGGGGYCFLEGFFPYF